MATYGWDTDTQRIGRIPGLGIIENGYFDFSSGTEAIDVATHMQEVVMGFGIARTQGPPDFQGLVATTDGDATNGWVTWTRQTTYVDETLRVYYQMTGY